MIHLRREIAPISADVWQLIDEEARVVLELNLAGRRLVDVVGPKGWGFAAVPTGNLDELSGAPSEGVRVLRRKPQPLIELWTRFELARDEIDRVPRRGKDIDLRPVLDAAERMAAVEDRAVFHGYGEAGITGLAQDSPHAPLVITDDYTSYPSSVVEATEQLASAGVQGPYALALGSRCYTGLRKASDPNGYPVLSRLQKLLDGPIVRAPAIDGAVLMSVRGGDFVLTLGQDYSIGYRSYDERNVQLFMASSFTFQLIAPEAAVALRYR
jgi:uncharacterized linocin/CFP29 family protein